jgi:hypothetical protein
LFRGAQGVHESDTYLAILDEGALKHMRELVLRIGQEKLGPPPNDVVAAVKGIEDLGRLDRFIVGYTKVSSWQELLQLP